MGGTGTDTTQGRLGVLRHRRFATFWAAGLASNTGTWLHIVTSTILVYAWTESTAALGLLGLVAYLPLLLFTIPAGVASDRWDRRTVVTVSSLGGAVAAIGLAVMVHLGSRSVEAVALSAFAMYTAYAVSKPALSAIFPALVPREEIQQATAINSLSFILGQLMGPLLASACIALGVPALAFALNGLSYLGVIVVVGRMPQPARADAGRARRSVVGEVRDAFAAIRRDRRVQAMLIVVLLVSPLPEVVRLLAPAQIAGAGGSQESAGFVAAAIGLGSAVGLTFVARQRRSGDRLLLSLGIGGLALVSMVVAAGGGPAIVIAGALGIGLAYGVVFGTATGRIQASLTDAYRGRVMAIHTLAHLGTRPLYTPVAGALAAAGGIVVAIGAFVLLLPVAFVAARRAPGEPPSAVLEATGAPAKVA